MLLYAVIRTRWGYFGLVGGENGLLRTHLPAADYEKVKLRLLNKWKRLVWLTINYIADKALRKDKRGKKADLMAKYETAKYAAMTPKQIAAELKKELDALEEDDDDL